VLDPTALPLLWLWDYQSPHPAIPAIDKIASALQLVGWRKVQRAPGKVFLPRPGMALDFGGFGKEYAVDIVAEIALKHGLQHVLVDFGHDLRAIGAPAPRPCWHIGLEDPRDPGAYSGSIGVSAKGIASSGDYLRCFTINGRRYGHIVDPRTGWPVANGCTQATVIADTCLQAGVLSTAAFVFGLKQGIEFIEGFPGAEGRLVGESTRAQTRGFFHYVVSN
jgi:thiamine biosynthesis lipoprotein